MLKLAAKSAFFLSAVASACETQGTYNNEKGSFSMSWCYPSEDSIQLTVSMAGTAFVGIGFGGSMYEADLVAGWVDGNGTAVINDYWSEQEGKPSEDTALGGTNDVNAISATTDGTSTTMVFSRKLVTGDKYDTNISITEPNDMVYAWATGSEGIVYHGPDNHNHIYVDFTKTNGIPDTAFGEEESGKLSRQLVANAYYATLSTIQTEAAGASNVYNFPYGSVADTSDEEPSTGRPLMLLSELERNVMNIASNPKVSLHYMSPPSNMEELKHPEHYDVMTKPRTTLLGHLEVVPDDELDHAKETYLKKHPNSKAWINFSDFAMYRMVVEDVYAVGGFGNDHYIGWISSEQYLSEQP